MKKSQLSDKQLEDLLGQMPKIKDHRDSRDIYQNIAHRVEKRKKMPTWVIPGAALAAVLFLAFILSPGLMGNNYSEQKSMDSSSAKEENSSMEMDTAIGDDSAKVEKENTLMRDSADGKEKAEEFAAMNKANPYDGLISVYPDEFDTETSDIFTFAIPDQQAQAVVPITVTKAKETGKSWIESYTETMPQLNEEDWGLTDYYPMDASWSYDKATKTLTMDVKENHPYRYGSAAEVMFVDSMTQNFSDVGIEKMVLTTEGNPGIELGNYGSKEEFQLNTEATKRRAYLFLTVEGMPNPYLVPTKEQHKSIGDAFKEMWKGDEIGYLSPSLPENFKLAKTESNDKVLEITLTDDTKLQEDFMPNLEAILMTASEFDYKGVRFTNANIDQLGPFDLKEVLPLPLAPNKKQIESE
ncbi:hypothetical protein J7E38_01565 [Bacillus sp. ISL-35]|uniref:hypothetical protein n=1 Tax=Bacillus sp. ISL-35 TaxID=2819122 RepID=UPI001BEB34D9|nr:hypothetical protein [Bacillus sp. ISL-35]MBT2677667.1 hypothetical protein [Bacillus sp. ISL-35]MBT2704619.1 hypothetical protein [Chryseobacterium sp. ISL-80]